MADPGDQLTLALFPCPFLCPAQLDRQRPAGELLAQQHRPGHEDHPDQQAGDQRPAELFGEHEAADRDDETQGCQQWHHLHEREADAEVALEHLEQCPQGEDRDAAGQQRPRADVQQFLTHVPTPTGT